jgi:hypothetical protein
MVGQIIYSEKFEVYLDSLIYKLYKQEYFLYKENSVKYVSKIYQDIDNVIDVKKHKQTPLELVKYGKYYITIQGSKKTTWYVFFNKKDTKYLIKYITNNHVAKSTFINLL